MATAIRGAIATTLKSQTLIRSGSGSLSAGSSVCSMWPPSIRRSSYLLLFAVFPCPRLSGSVSFTCGRDRWKNVSPLVEGFLVTNVVSTSYTLEGLGIAKNLIMASRPMCD
ncbi:hypothetical protein DAEQUDRAFT_353979 [Daedalea quercina L-15889]|uniref:Uncharacterized protein n=1 Tax=Daedalea quercina L-15889 TaxID=1314783 RepID=A0A165TQ66_9APHY|nr:hypothetical protein DAEQUDRAFT_353979 [Daedalea quercina L-15889]